MKDSGGNTDEFDYDYVSQDERGGEDKLGLSENPGILEVRMVEQTSSLQSKPKISEKKRQGARTTIMKVEMAGNAADQSKLLRSGKGYVFSRWP